MSRKRRGFDASFKLQVVQMVREQGLADYPFWLCSATTSVPTTCSAA